MDTNINIPKKEIAPGVFSTGGTATMPTVNPINNQSNVITPQSLAPVTPIPLPQTPVVTTPQQITNMASPFLEELKLNEQEQKAQQFQTAGIDQLIRDTIALEGEGQTRAEEFAKAGVNTLKQDLQNINSQILKKQAEVQQDDITLVANMRAEERRDTLLPFAEMGKAKLAGDAMIVRALKNAEIGVLNATALAKQGDIALAIQTAEEAVATKYAPYKASIERYDTIIKALEPYLTSAEKKEANKQQFKGQMAMREIEKAEENEKAISKMIIDATPNAPADIIANAKKISENGGSTLEVAQALGKYGGDYLKTELLKAQIQTEKAQRSNYLANAEKTRTETGLLGQPVGVDGVIATLPKSSQERYYKLQGDFDQATKNYRGAIDSASSITALSKDATPQQQTAIIFQYMKTLDPSSTVREGEFALVGATAGLGDRAVNALKRLDNGSRLNETQINDIVGATKILAENAKKNLEATSNEYDRRAVKFGLPKGLFYEQQDMAQSPADNKFGQAIGIQAPVNYNTTGMSVKPDGSIQFTLPTINKSN